MTNNLLPGGELGAGSRSLIREAEMATL